MEVLIALFILSIGLLGVAALIPIGRYSVAEATKADRCAACGHAALDEIKTRGLVDASVWAYDTTSLTSGATFAIDPLDTSGAPLGTLPRLKYTNNAAAGPIFICNDDLLFDTPDDSSLRPRGLQLDGSVGAPTSEGRYTWLFTASPSPAEDAAASSDWSNRKTFTVSAVVCFQRDLTGSEDKSFAPAWTPSGKFMQVGANLGIERDDWILVCGSRGVPVGVWYRVVSAGGHGNTSYLTLQGPDWQYGTDNVTAVYMPSVVGVYTTTVRLP